MPIHTICAKGSGSAIRAAVRFMLRVHFLGFIVPVFPACYDFFFRGKEMENLLFKPFF
jgi:hypothetical protein